MEKLMNVSNYKKKENRILDTLNRFSRNAGAIIGIILLIIFLFGVIFANQICPEKLVTLMNASERLQSPSREHIFGTDVYGRDIFARVLFGSRNSLAIGVITSFSSLILGCIFGASAAYYGGMTDNLIMRIMDILSSIPGTLLALAIVAVLGKNMTNLMIALTVSHIPTFVRLTRAAVLTVVESDYVEAARACGTRDGRIIFHHILPNAIGPIIVQTTSSIAGIIHLASGISFIGMGVQPPKPEWGAMIAEAREFMYIKPYLIIFPGLAIILASLSFTLIGDGLREALDPRLRD